MTLLLLVISSIMSPSIASPYVILLGPNPLNSNFIFSDDLRLLVKGAVGGHCPIKSDWSGEVLTNVVKEKEKTKYK